MLTQNMKTLFFAALCALSANATAGLPESFTFQGQLADTSGTAVTSPTVVLKIQIFNPALDCLLYEEQQSTDTSATNGFFSLSIGSATGAAKRGAGDPSLAMRDVFSNAATVRGPSPGCASGYTPVGGDARRVRVTIVSVGGNPVNDVLAAQVLQAVPYAGVAADLEPTSTVNMNNQRLANLLSPSANQDAATKLYCDSNVAGQAYGGGAPTSGQFLKFSGGQWTPSNLPASGVTSVSTGTGLLGGPITGSGMISVDVGATANKIVQLDGLGKLPAVDGSLLTNISAAAVSSGTIPVANLPIGSTGSTVAAGNDSRFTDSRTPTGAAGGDLSASYPNPTVAGLQGVPVFATAPQPGQPLAYNGGMSRWEPSPGLQLSGQPAINLMATNTTTDSLIKTSTNTINGSFEIISIGNGLGSAPAIGAASSSSQYAIVANNMSNGYGLYAISTAGYPVFAQANASNNLAAIGVKHVNWAIGRPLVSFIDGGGSIQGSIAVGASTTQVVYNTTSDRRLKTHIEPTAMNAMALIDRLQVVDYNFKSDPNDHRQTGFIAQDLYQIYPQAVTRPPNPDDRWMVDYGRVTPLLAQALKEHQDELRRLHEENAELKARLEKLEQGR